MNEPLCRQIIFDFLRNHASGEPPDQIPTDMLIVLLRQNYGHETLWPLVESCLMSLLASEEIPVRVTQRTLVVHGQNARNCFGG